MYYTIDFRFNESLNKFNQLAACTAENILDSEFDDWSEMVYEENGGSDTLGYYEAETGTYHGYENLIDSAYDELAEELSEAIYDRSISSFRGIINYLKEHLAPEFAAYITAKLKYEIFELKDVSGLHVEFQTARKLNNDMFDNFLDEFTERLYDMFPREEEIEVDYTRYKFKVNFEEMLNEYLLSKEFGLSYDVDGQHDIMDIYDGGRK